MSSSNFDRSFDTYQAKTGGEDACFANSDAGGVFAIADGVSGYATFAAMNCFSAKRSAAVNCIQCFSHLLLLSAFSIFNKDIYCQQYALTHGFYPASHSLIY